MPTAVADEEKVIAAPIFITETFIGVSTFSGMKCKEFCDQEDEVDCHKNLSPNIVDDATKGPATLKPIVLPVVPIVTLVTADKDEVAGTEKLICCAAVPIVKAPPAFARLTVPLVKTELEAEIATPPPPPAPPIIVIALLPPPDKVMLFPPANCNVEPLAEELPTTLPAKVTQLFSAAAPGAATLTVIPLLAIVPVALTPLKAAVALTKLLLSVVFIRLVVFAVGKALDVTALVALVC